MAAVHYSPTPTEIEDPVTYEGASALLKRTGHPASPRTIARWVSQANDTRLNPGAARIAVERVGKTDYVSWTLVLREHRRRTAVKLRASAAW